MSTRKLVDSIREGAYKLSRLSDEDLEERTGEISAVNEVIWETYYKTDDEEWED